MKKMKFKIKESDGYICLSLSENNDFSDVKRLKADYFDEIASTEDNGYIVMPRGDGNADYSLLYFNRHSENFEKEITNCNMPVFGFKTDKKCYLGIVSGMSYDYTLKIVLKDGKYRIYPIFEINGEQPYEDLKVEYFELTGEDASYSGMARKYRQFRMEKGELKPFSEKLNESTDYTVNSVMIRVRLGWKPAPPEILHQTLENEPPMFVACNFERVGNILDELKAQGVEKAEICLVGWNIKGHDGRWPQAFPVCEELGGEEKLKKLIKKAQTMGYKIVCHTNHTDQYEIADCFDSDNTAVYKNGKPLINGTSWSGGEMYWLCHKVGYEQAKKMLPEVAKLGFKGSHYIDVLGVLPVRKCYHEKHPVNSGESAKYARKMCELARELFGGISSEGAYDFIAPHLDYGLYISFSEADGNLCDKSIPFWQLVYHGSVLSNPYTHTVNSTFKDEKTVLKMIEYGGRPSYYFYSAFVDKNDNWNNGMGDVDTDAVCGSDEQLKKSVAKIKEGYDIYESLQEIHTAFMENHAEISENVFEITYSNGIKITVDYNKKEYKLIKTSTI